MDEKFYYLHDNNILIDWCIYNELLKGRKKRKDKDLIETSDINKELWNMFVIKYQIIKNKETRPLNIDRLLNQILERISIDFKKNKQFPFDKDAFLGDFKPENLDEKETKKSKDMLYTLLLYYAKYEENIKDDGDEYISKMTATYSHPEGL